MTTWPPSPTQNPKSSPRNGTSTPNFPAFPSDAAQSDAQDSSSGTLSSSWQVSITLMVYLSFYGRSQYMHLSEVNMRFILMFQTLICATSFATFAVSRKLPQNRLQLSITLMLTAVTFRLTTNANLPKISYHTRLVSVFSVVCFLNVNYAYYIYR